MINSSDQKYMESFVMWCWRRMEKTICTGRVKNEKILYNVKEENNSLHKIRKRKAILD
jgi:hypothetical protein